MTESLAPTNFDQNSGAESKHRLDPFSFGMTMIREVSGLTFNADVISAAENIFLSPAGQDFRGRNRNLFDREISTASFTGAVRAYAEYPQNEKDYEGVPTKVKFYLVPYGSVNKHPQVVIEFSREKGGSSEEYFLNVDARVGSLSGKNVVISVFNNPYRDLLKIELVKDLVLKQTIELEAPKEDGVDRRKKLEFNFYANRISAQCHLKEIGKSEEGTFESSEVFFQTHDDRGNQKNRYRLLVAGGDLKLFGDSWLQKQEIGVDSIPYKLSIEGGSGVTYLHLQNDPTSWNTPGVDLLIPISFSLDQLNFTDKLAGIFPELFV